jgi:hypothetical protein
MSLVTAQAINSYIVLHIWLGFVSSSLIVVVIIYACFIHNRTGDAAVRGVRHAACVELCISSSRSPPPRNLFLLLFFLLFSIPHQQLNNVGP